MTSQSDKRKPGQRGRHRKYGQYLGLVTELATTVQKETKTYSVNLYGKQRQVRAYDHIVKVKTVKVKTLTMSRSSGLGFSSDTMDCSVYHGFRFIGYPNH